MIERNGLDQRVELLARVNAEVDPGAPGNPRRQHDLADSDLDVDDRPGLFPN